MLFKTLRRFYSYSAVPLVTINKTSHYELEVPYPPKHKPVKLCLQPNSTFFNLVESFYAFYITGKITIIDTANKAEVDINSRIIDFIDEPASKRYQVQLNKVPLVDITNKMISPEFDIAKFVNDEHSTFRYIKELEKQGTNEDAAQLMSYYITSAVSGFNKTVKTKLEMEEYLAQLKDQFMDFRLRNRMSNLLNDRNNEIERLLDGLKMEKKLIEEPIEKKMKLYAWLVVLATALQLGFFYYTIYCVDWLGWDIMEPITYSLDLLSALIVMRFFYKYKRTRSFHGVRQVFKQKYFMQKPGLKLRYENIEEKIADLETKRNLIQLLTKHHI